MDDRSTQISAQKIELRRTGCYLTDTLLRRMLRAIFPDHRRHERLLVPPLVGYLGIARASKVYPLGDISLSGFCMLTDERWTPGTEMPITLQQVSLPGDCETACFTVQATVVRCGDDGVGFSILLGEEDSSAAYANPLRVSWISKTEMQQFLNRLKQPQGDGAKQPEGLQGAGGALQPGSALKPAFLGNR